MPPEKCPDHGELKEKVKNMEERIDCVEDKQYDYRKPGGAIAELHEKINTRATKDDLGELGRSLKWFIGILVTILLFAVGGSFVYTRNISSDLSAVAQGQAVLKERVDREVVTKQDLKCMKEELKEIIKERPK